MCCSIGKANFAGTFEGTYRTKKKIGRTIKPIDVSFYQNKAQSLERGAKGKAGGNSMILHFPAKVAMTQKNFVSTEECPHILEDMKRAYDNVYGAKALSLSDGMRGGPKPEVFNYDIYTVVLCQSAAQIPSALSQVPADRRPPMNKILFDWYDRTYRDWSFALCCFNTAELTQAKPIMVWYEPMFQYQLRAPAIDAHTGGIPNVQARVDTDHFVFFATDEMSDDVSVPVYYRDPVSEDMMAMLPKRIWGFETHQKLQNGDFVITTGSLESDTPTVMRMWEPTNRFRAS